MREEVGGPRSGDRGKSRSARRGAARSGARVDRPAGREPLTTARAGLTPVTRFADFALDPDAGELRRSGKRIAIAQKPFSMLCYLVANPPRVVPKEELLRRLWPGVTVSDSALWSALKDLRRALEDSGSRSRFLQTVRGRGIRFVGELADRELAAVAAPPALEPEGLAARHPFVDRLREMRELLRCAESAALGRPRLVLITGPSGAGKTRLVTEFLKHPATVPGAVNWRGGGNGGTAAAIEDLLITNRTTTVNPLYPASLNPAAIPGWNGPYIKEVPLDPWGNPYVVNVRYLDGAGVGGVSTAIERSHAVFVISAGPNNLFETSFQDATPLSVAGGDDIAWTVEGQRP